MSLTTVTNPSLNPGSFERHAAEAAMAWYGWGSPVGLSIGLVGVGIAAALIRFAVMGF